MKLVKEKTIKNSTLYDERSWCMVAFFPRKYVQGGAKRQDLDTDMQKEYNRLDTQSAHNGVGVLRLT